MVMGRFPSGLICAYECRCAGTSFAGRDSITSTWTRHSMLPVCIINPSAALRLCVGKTVEPSPMTPFGSRADQPASSDAIRAELP